MSLLARIGAIGVVTVALFALSAALSSPSAQARVGTYKLAIIRIKYSDTASTPYTLDALKTAGTEIHKTGSAGAVCLS